MLAVVVVITSLMITALLLYPRANPKKIDPLKNRVVFGFFHPFCNAGGGGERVLWTAVFGILQKWDKSHCIIYARHDIEASIPELLAKVHSQFHISIDPQRISLVKLYTWPWLESARYKRFTLIAQSIGSMRVGYEAASLNKPDIFIDTLGHAFIYPVVKLLFGCPIIAYVHYPTVSTDMLNKVKNRISDFNNVNSISNNALLTNLKVWYYYMFSVLYGYVGRYADVVMVNSTWTLNHINSIWNQPSRTLIVYPPTNTDDLVKMKLGCRTRTILSVGQFRPEKAHKFQIDIFHKLLSDHPEFLEGKDKVELVFIGGCRNNEDDERVNDLQAYCKSLSLQKCIKFVKNASYEELLEYYRRSSIGLHAMWNEHFGIGVVEYMAAGLIAVAHNSGGPKMDIINNDSSEYHFLGYLASSKTEYVTTIAKILNQPDKVTDEMRERARESVRDRFSENRFIEKFVDGVSSLFR